MRVGFFGGHGGGGPHVFGILFLIAFVAAVVVLVVFVVRWARGGHPPSASQAGQPSPTDGAIAAVRMRYARGELSREEFLRVSADLHEQASPGA